MASILQQGDGSSNGNQFDQESQSSNRNNVPDKSQDTFKRLQLAELAAAEEKHNRLLKKLKQGGHDTRNLENTWGIWGYRDIHGKTRQYMGICGH